MSVKAICVMDHTCLISLLSAHWAVFPPRIPLKGLQTSFVKNMRERQQHLKKNDREDMYKTAYFDISFHD